MDREEILKLAAQYFTGLYIKWNEPTGKPDWSVIKDKVSVPANVEQLEAFANAIAAHEREQILLMLCDDIDKDYEPETFEAICDAIRSRGTKGQ